MFLIESINLLLQFLHKIGGICILNTGKCHFCHQAQHYVAFHSVRVILKV